MADGLARAGVSIPDLVDWSKRAQHLRSVRRVHVSERRRSPASTCRRASPPFRSTRNLLDVWGITPQMGRTFAADEATPAASASSSSPTPSGSASCRRRTRRGRQDAVDRRPAPHTIVGVLPPYCGQGHFQDDGRRRRPSCSIASAAERDDRRLYVTAVLKPGVALEQAEADLAAVASQLQTDYPLHQREDRRGRAPADRAARREHQRRHGTCSRLIAVIVFCIACANVSSIILAHAATRRRELAVRSALGAGRLQQVRQFMIESLVTSSAAGAVGLVLAWWGLIALRFASATHRRLRRDGAERPRPCGRRRMSRCSRRWASRCCRRCACRGPTWTSCARATAAPRRRSAAGSAKSLVVAQVALALILMTQVGLIGRTTWRLHHLDKGFDAGAGC